MVYCTERSKGLNNKLKGITMKFYTTAKLTEFNEMLKREYVVKLM